MGLFIGVKNVSHDGIPLHNIAVWNEYGTELAPPRPAFRMGAEKAIMSNRKMIQAQLGNIARSGLGKRKPSKALMRMRQKNMLTALGKSAVKHTRDIIKAGSTEPNAPATIRKKGFDHPLFETGVLMKNLDFAVGE